MRVCMWVGVGVCVCVCVCVCVREKELTSDDVTHSFIRSVVLLSAIKKIFLTFLLPSFRLTQCTKGRVFINRPGNPASLVRLLP